MAKITIQTLLDAGCHYGHQTRRWNPKMKSYIFGERNGIYILDLKQTMIGADRAYTFLKETATKGGNILFVGTKKQAQEPIAAQAERCGMPYINQRWLGGMLTNFVTIRSRIQRMEELEAMVEDGRMARLPKKEQAVLSKAPGQPRRRPHHDRPPAGHLRRRLQARGDRGPRGQPPAHPRREPARHQLRPRRHRLRHPRQR